MDDREGSPGAYQMPLVVVTRQNLWCIGVKLTPLELWLLRQRFLPWAVRSRLVDLGIKVRCRLQSFSMVRRLFGGATVQRLPMMPYRSYGKHWRNSGK